MKLYQPVKPWRITQLFGENKACVSLDGTNKVITCDGSNPPPGYKSLYGKRGHLGLDLAIKSGQEIYAAHDGTVYFIDTQPKSGLDVRIEGKGFRTIYEHLQGHNVKVGDKVVAGQLIGWGDNTGYSSGDHLHWQYEELQPDGKTWIAQDPLKETENLFALEYRKMTSLVGYLKEYLAIVLDRQATKLRK